MTDRAALPLLSTVAAGVIADLEALGDLPPACASLAAAAIVLACSLDEGAGMSTAAVARELRATMTALRDGAKVDDDGGDALEEWVAGLSAEVRDPTQS